MEEFQVIQPSLLLTPYVKQYWFLKTNNTSPTQQRIIPNGSASLIFHKESNMFSISEDEIQANAFISGQSTRYSDLLQTGAVDMISITFQPHGAKAFVNELFETNVSIDDINDCNLNELQDRLMNTVDIPSCVQLIETFLLI